MVTGVPRVKENWPFLPPQAMTIGITHSAYTLMDVQAELNCMAG